MTAHAFSIPTQVGIGYDVSAVVAPTPPSSITDWGPYINTAVAAGHKRLLLPDYNGNGSTDYPFSTQLDFTNVRGLTIEADHGLVPPYGVSPTDKAPVRMVWKGTGTTPAIKGVNSTGVTFRNLGIYYDSGSFTGKLLDLGGPTVNWTIDNCHVSSIPRTAPLLKTALALVGLDGAVCTTISNSVLGGAQWLVLGYQGVFSNAIRITNNMFHSASTAMIGNVSQQWDISENTFEMNVDGTDTPAVIDSNSDAGTAHFTFADNWVGDMSGSMRPLFRQKTTSNWYASFTGNFIATVNGSSTQPIFDLQRSGVIVIRDNPYISTNDTAGILVDLGDTTAGVVPKEGFTWENNGGVNVHGAPIKNRAGHYGLSVKSSQASGIRELIGLSGHERIEYPDRRVATSVVVGAPAGSGASIAVEGSDMAGIVRLTTGTGTSAGIIATITFGTAPVPAPGGNATYQTPIVALTPYGMGGYDGAAAAAGNPYVKVISGDQTQFQIGVQTALAASTAMMFAYRVIEL